MILSPLVYDTSAPLTLMARLRYICIACELLIIYLQLLCLRFPVTYVIVFEYGLPLHVGQKVYSTVLNFMHSGRNASVLPKHLLLRSDCALLTLSSKTDPIDARNRCTYRSEHTRRHPLAAPQNTGIANTHCRALLSSVHKRT
jgi:hypothetical protein